MTRVLVIDDCPDLRRATHCQLKREGFDVIEAGDAVAGLQRAVEDAPDLILVAADLVGLDGFEVCQRLTKEPSTHRIPVLIVAEGLDEESTRRAKKVGAEALVLASDRPENLSSMVREQLWFSAGHGKSRTAFSSNAERARGSRIRAHA